jgi:segregation and condensation protein A
MNERVGSLPLAVVRGEQVVTLPQDLYIPPDALEIFLEAFEGPLDLLLYLIRRQNFDIRDIPIAQITAQYMRYVELMQEFKLDLAAEYLLMAAVLAEIKSRLLLPRPNTVETEETDPRAQLIQQLQAYEECKRAALALDALPRLERDVLPAKAYADVPTLPKLLPEVELTELMLAFQAILKQAELVSRHEIKREHLSIRARMTQVLSYLQYQSLVEFECLFSSEEGRRGVIVSLMAILELLKAQLIEVVQADIAYAPLYIRRLKDCAQDRL